jgi:predicted permease
MGTILSVTFPFFGLVLCGYGTFRRGWIAAEAIPGLNFYVLYLALPAMLWRFASTTPIASLWVPSLVLDYAICTSCLLGLALCMSRRAGLGWNHAAFAALVAVFPNSGFMGVPLLVALLGAPAAAPAMVSLSFDMVLTSSLCIALSRLQGQGALGAGRAARQALVGMVANPLPWAIFLGSFFSTFQWALPGAMSSMLNMLAQSASPVALFTLGGMLARTHGQARATAPFTSTGDVWKIVGLKLLVHPALVWVCSQALVWAGMPLDPFSVMVLVLVAALPSASNVPMLAERFGSDAGQLARVVMGSTTLAFVSFTLAVMVVVPDPLLRQGA